MGENVEHVEEESALKSFADELIDRNEDKLSPEDQNSLKEITDGYELLRRVVELLLSDESLSLLKCVSVIDDDIDYNLLKDVYVKFDDLEGAIDELAQVGLLKTEDNIIAFTSSEARKVFKEDGEEYHSLASQYYSKKAETQNTTDVKAKALKHSILSGDNSKAFDLFFELSKNPGKFVEEIAEAGDKLLESFEGEKKGEILKILGGLYFDSSGFEKAKDRYSQAIEIYIDLAHQDSERYMPELAKIINNLGNTCRYRGDTEEGEKHFKWAATIFTEFNLPENLAITLENLGTLYLDAKRYDEAEDMFKQVIELRKDVLKGENPPGVATGYHNLAAVYKFQERVEDAENTYNELIEVLKEIGGEEYKAFISEAMNGLAAYYVHLGRTDEALELVQEVLKDLELVPEIRTGVYVTAAKAHEMKGEKELAADLYMKAASLSFILFRNYGIFISNFLFHLERVEELASGELRGDATLMRLGILKNYYGQRKMEFNEIECGQRGQMILHAVKGKSIDRFKVESQEDKAAYIIANDIR